MLAAVDRVLYSRWFVRMSALLTIGGVISTFHTALGLLGHTSGLTGLGLILVVVGLCAGFGAVSVRRRVLHAAELCRGMIETNRHMMFHAVSEGLYWPAELVGQGDSGGNLHAASGPLLDKPAVYRAVQDAIVRFQTWTDRSTKHLGGSLPVDQIPRLSDDIGTVQNAVDVLDALIAELVALPAFWPKRR